ncbi:MAG: hypothetical protein R6W77_15935 [Trueperaceae bacterium]
MFETIAWQRYARDRIEDLHREAARVSALRRSRAALPCPASSGSSGGATTMTCCGVVAQPCC